MGHHLISVISGRFFVDRPLPLIRLLEVLFRFPGTGLSASDALPEVHCASPRPSIFLLYVWRPRAVGGSPPAVEGPGLAAEGPAPSFHLQQLAQARLSLEAVSRRCLSASRANWLAPRLFRRFGAALGGGPFGGGPARGKKPGLGHFGCAGAAEGPALGGVFGAADITADLSIWYSVVSLSHSLSGMFPFVLLH